MITRRRGVRAGGGGGGGDRASSKAEEDEEEKLKQKKQKKDEQKKQIAEREEARKMTPAASIHLRLGSTSAVLQAHIASYLDCSDHFRLANCSCALQQLSIHQPSSHPPGAIVISHCRGRLMICQHPCYGYALPTTLCRQCVAVDGLTVASAIDRVLSLGQRIYRIGLRCLCFCCSAEYR